MFKLTAELHENVVDIINKIKNINDTGIELEIPEGAILLENVLNLRLIQKKADDYGKVVHFFTRDENGQNLLALLSEPDTSDFIPKEQVLFADHTHQSSFDDQPHKQLRHGQRPKMHIKLKSLLTPIVGILKMPKFRRPNKLKHLFLFGLIVGGLAFVGYQLLYKVPKAQVKITVNSQPLTKSVQIKVVKDAENDAKAKRLKGYGVETTVTKKSSVETTGEKLIGEKATGEVKIYNKTLTEKSFDAGEILVYKEGDEDLQFILDDGVTVPAAVESDTDPPVITSGEATVEVTALDIGSTYNLDKDSKLEFEDYSTDDYSAKAKEDISGGSSDTVKIVTQADKDALALKVTNELAQEVDSALSTAATGDRKYIKGSSQSVTKNQLYSADIDEEVDILELTQDDVATGLAYSQKDIDKILNDLLEEFIPDGYVLSSEDKDIKVEILGNTETTVASPTESDLQVTIKALVVPDIQEDEIKTQITGKTLAEAQKILGSVQNVKSYELEITPNIPFLQRMPRESEKITLEIKKE